MKIQSILAVLLFAAFAWISIWALAGIQATERFP